MKIVIGTKNAVKADALRQVLQDYNLFSNSEVAAVEVSSGVPEQPKTLDETIKGAMNRARNAFQKCRYSFGIEDGLMQVPNTKSGYMNVCACAIFDGSGYHLGLGPAFEYPKKVVDLIFKKNLDVDQAFFEAGLTDDPRIGKSGGVIGSLTMGKLPRKEYTKQAIIMALIHLESSDMMD